MQNKKRIILHIDFNSYFASVEQQANPFLNGKAIGIGGKPGSRSIISTASIEAKNQGIKTAMASSLAVKLVPSLQLINGDPEKYNEITKRFLNILNRHSDIVEQFSIDEAFLDLTNRCTDYMDAIAIALRIRNDLKNEVGSTITASIGISDNKLIAKIASESEKPNGVTVVYPDEKEAFLNSRMLSDVPGIGFSILRRLEELGISTFKDLRTLPLSHLLIHFKQYGSFLYNAVRGIDHNPVSNIIEIPKSIGHSYTLPFNTQSPQILRSTLLNLSNKVAWRLRKHNLSARGFSATVRFDNMRFHKSIGSFNAPISEGLDIFNEAWGKILPLLETNNIRLIGISVHKLVPFHEQMSADKKQQKKANLIPALDKIQNRYGQNSWLRASELLSIKIKENTNGFLFNNVKKSNKVC